MEAVNAVSAAPVVVPQRPVANREPLQRPVEGTEGTRVRQEPPRPSVHSGKAAAERLVRDSANTIREQLDDPPQLETLATQPPTPARTDSSAGDARQVTTSSDAVEVSRETARADSVSLSSRDDSAAAAAPTDRSGADRASRASMSQAGPAVAEAASASNPTTGTPSTRDVPQTQAAPRDDFSPAPSSGPLGKRVDLYV